MEPLLRRVSGQICVVAVSAVLAGCGKTQSTLDPNSSSARLVANFWWGMLAVGALIFAVVVLLLLIGLWRSRDGAERPLTKRGAWLLVLAGGVVTPAVVILAMVIVGVLVGREIATVPGGAGPTVEVRGRMWWWEFRYLDREGNRVATTANEMHVPVGEPVRLRLVSDNVIHSFWVPQLQGKTDLVPGQVNESWLEADTAGVYRGQCAEYCGQQHALMGFLVVAEPPAQFRSWLARQSAPAAEPDDPVLARGQAVFLSAGCGNCHTIRGTAADGELGPDLTHVAGRRTLAAATIPNTRGHLGGWVADPQGIKPGATMPPTAVAPQDFTALLSYLGNLQ